MTILTAEDHHSIVTGTLIPQEFNPSTLDRYVAPELKLEPI